MRRNIVMLTLCCLALGSGLIWLYSCGSDKSTGDNPSLAVCGNSAVETGEQCDDGNTTDGDGCSADCQYEPACGNGNLEPGEVCDDGNTADGDGCSSTCQIEAAICGNNVVEAGESCDDGNTVNGDGCSSTCQVEVPLCGNSVVDPGETCDDGNTTSYDGCSSACQTECAKNGVYRTKYRLPMPSNVNDFELVVHDGKVASLYASLPLSKPSCEVGFTCPASLRVCSMVDSISVAINPVTCSFTFTPKKCGAEALCEPGCFEMTGTFTSLTAVSGTFRAKTVVNVSCNLSSGGSKDWSAAYASGAAPRDCR
jgi:cysteine-rich repeat protein